MAGSFAGYVVQLFNEPVRYSFHIVSFIPPFPAIFAVSHLCLNRGQITNEIASEEDIQRMIDTATKGNGWTAY